MRVIRHWWPNSQKVEAYAIHSCGGLLSHEECDVL